MDICFYDRRILVNSDIPIKSIKEYYRFFFNFKIIIKDFQLLMVVDVKEVFLTELNINPNYEICFFKKQKHPLN